MQHIGKQSTPKPIGLLGGTFDPIHNGHVRLAEAARDTLDLADVRLIPAADPYQKTRAPLASAAHRLAMVAAAVAGKPGLIADGRELARSGATYTVDTLRQMRQEPALTNVPLVWLIGMDAFCGLPRWHDWQALFDLTHFAVFGRPGDAALPPALANIIASRRQALTGAWREQPAGAVVEMPLAPMDISSTAVRQRLLAGESVAHLLAPAICEYISRFGLYRTQEPNATQTLPEQEKERHHRRP
jgi:nicotinate-nucleotide adenylyltransferase